MALTKRQKTTLKKHKKHHTAKHMTTMRKAMRKGKSFTQAHKLAMKKKRGEKMRKKGAKGAPTAKAFKKSQA